MTVADLLMEGVILMLLGMGSVFIFLVALVLAMYGMSRMAHRLSPDELAIEASSFPAGAPRAETDDELIAVISAAISRYRSDKQ